MWLTVQLQDPFLNIGVTTKGPDSGLMLEALGPYAESDQHWYVKIGRRRLSAEQKGQLGQLPWELEFSQGRTVGCWVSKNGDFHLCCGKTDVDDVVGRGLPTDRPLWGFVALIGAWKVEANYQAMPKGEAMVHECMV